MAPPLRIALDARMIAHSGIGTYIRGLVKGLARLEPPVHVVALGAESGLRASIYGLREQIAVPRAFARVAPPAALLHVPHYNAPLRGVRAPLVVTVHDLIHVKFPGHARRRGARAYARFMLPRVCRRAAAVLCDSEATRRDLVELVPDAAGRARVVPMGCDVVEPPPDARDATLKRLGLAAGYVLYLGNIRPHKNVDALVGAWEALPSTGRPPLVLAGEDQMPRSWGGRGRPGVRFLGRVADDEIAPLYAGAAVFAFPSLYEGFGLPPLEAMACGTPVVCSNAGALPEVVGDGALLVAPRDEAALSRAIGRVLEDRGLREELRAKGRARARSFTWDRTARETRDAYEAALAASR